jgi:hypothetical protein
MRDLSWPTAVSQLVAILAMALVKALVRRRLGQPLSSVPALDCHELDCELQGRVLPVIFSLNLTGLTLRLVYQEDALEPPPQNEPSTGFAKIIRWRILTEADPSSLRPVNDPKGSPIPRDPESRAPSKKKLKRTKRHLLAKQGKLILEDQDAALNLPQKSSNQSLTSPSRFFNPSSQMALNVRRRLGQLSKIPGTASIESIALTRAINLILDSLIPIRKGKDEQVSIRRFSWTLDTVVHHNTPQDRGKEDDNAAWTDTLMLEVQQEDKRWKVSSLEFDAILSLWMSAYATQYRQADSDNPTKSVDWLSDMASAIVTYRRVLGEAQAYLHDAEAKQSGPEDGTGHEIRQAPIINNTLIRDLNWWTNDPRITLLGHDRNVFEQMGPHQYAKQKSSLSDPDLVIGFRGLEKNSNPFGVTAKTRTQTARPQRTVERSIDGLTPNTSTPFLSLQPALLQVS